MRSEARGYALARRDLITFDRQFRAACDVQCPDRYRLLDALPADAPRIARGGGVSYAAASFGNGAISQDLGAFDRLLEFDADSGRLTVEAGMPVGEVQRFALARGWYLAVTPGHPRATIGGCIAADVHGKNPARDGTFRDQVEEIALHIPSHGAVTASRTLNSDLFAATFAGFGLTGTVAQATVQLARPPAALIVRRVPVDDFAQAARVLHEAAKAHVLYGWHDGRPEHFGRGVIRIGLSSEGGDAAVDRLPDARHDLPAAVPPLPFTAWSRTGIAAANAWLDFRWRRSGQSRMGWSEALFPLNAARLYFAGFGARGFAEAQWLVPRVRFERFAEALAEIVERDRPRIALVASKLFAGAADGFSFDGDGIALALQVPAPDAPAQRKFLEDLADVAITHGGRPNLIKQSSLDAATARRAITGFDAAKARLSACNSGGLHTSELARRLGL